MDFAPTPDQQAIADAVGTILARQAGPGRARSLGSGGHNDALLEALVSAGFLDLWHDETIGPLGAALVSQESSRHNARANVAVRALVAPAILGVEAPARVAVTRRDSTGPVRFGQYADVVLIVDGNEALAASVADVAPVETPYGYPYAYVEPVEERSLGPGSGALVSNWWRVALAAEMSGALEGAVAHTVAYLTQRKQFNKPLGALQAVQHRLAEAYVWSEGAKWLSRSAAFHHAAPTHAAAAAAYAAQAAQLIGADAHQLSGAIGFTTEFDLQLWTARLHALRVELGGITAHQLATTTAHWG